MASHTYLHLFRLLAIGANAWARAFFCLCLSLSVATTLDFFIISDLAHDGLIGESFRHICNIICWRILSLWERFWIGAHFWVEEGRAALDKLARLSFWCVAGLVCVSLLAAWHTPVHLLDDKKLIGGMCGRVDTHWIDTKFILGLYW